MDMQVLVSTEHDSVLQRDVQVVNIKCTFTDPNAETIVYDTNFVENLTFMTQTVIASVYDATVMVMESSATEHTEEQEQKHTKEDIQQRLGPMKRMNLSDSSTCLICHENITKNQFYRQLPTCEHKYHKKCIDRWIFQHPTCPTCRKNIFPSQNENSTE